MIPTEHSKPSSSFTTLFMPLSSDRFELLRQHGALLAALGWFVRGRCVAAEGGPGVRRQVVALQPRLRCHLRHHASHGRSVRHESKARVQLWLCTPQRCELVAPCKIPLPGWIRKLGWRYGGFSFSLFDIHSAFPQTDFGLL